MSGKVTVYRLRLEDEGFDGNFLLCRAGLPLLDHGRGVGPLRVRRAGRVGGLVMSEPRVVWMNGHERADMETGREAEITPLREDADDAPFLLLPIERTEDGAISVRVGDLTVRYLNNNRKLAIPFVAHPEDSSNANNVHRLARALITAAVEALGDPTPETDR